MISAVLVLQTNRDQTLRSADSRLAGAAIGTIIGGDNAAEVADLQ